MKIEGKYAILTGGARGLGKVTTQRLVEEGFRVLICDLHQREIDRTCREIDPSSKNVLGLQADVSKPSECKKLIAYAQKKFGRVDVLVNNAGICGPVGPIERQSSRQWVHTIENNFLSVFYCTKLVVPIMKEQGGGKIISMAGAGVGGKRPMERFTAYFSSKTAIVAFSEALAAELKESNIKVNCVSPGGVNTYFTDYILRQGVEKAGKEIYEQMRQQKESGGVSPLLAADLIVYLASDASNHITGKMLSAKWDTRDVLDKLGTKSSSHFTLRRIDGVLFDEKK